MDRLNEILNIANSQMIIQKLHQRESRYSFFGGGAGKRAQDPTFTRQLLCHPENLDVEQKDRDHKENEAQWLWEITSSWWKWWSRTAHSGREAASLAADGNTDTAPAIPEPPGYCYTCSPPTPALGLLQAPWEELCALLVLGRCFASHRSPQWVLGAGIIQLPPCGCQIHQVRIPQNQRMNAKEQWRLRVEKSYWEG